MDGEERTCLALLDPLYVCARAALLDAAEALAEQLDAVVLVGAQAVYIHTGDADFVATAPYTTNHSLYSIFWYGIRVSISGIAWISKI